MKVTHFFNRYPHPYQPYNERLIERQRKAGIDCAIFPLYGTRPPRRRSGFEKFVFLLKGLSKFSFSVRFGKTTGMSLRQSLIFIGQMVPLIRSKPDVIHIHMIQIVSSDVHALLSTMAIPWIVSLRGSDIAVKPLVDKRELEFVKSVMSHADGIHAVSQSLKNLAVAMGIEEGKISVIRRAPDDTEPVPRNVSFEDPVIHLTVVGRTHWTKGMVFAIRAVKILIDKNRQVVLHLVGEGDKEGESELKFWAAYLNLGSAVQFHGYLSSEEINQLLGKTHIYLQPSVSEGIPNTLVRAVNSKIPIVATNVGGIPEVIRADHGLLVQPGDPEALAAAIDKILTDKPFREQLFSKPPPANFDIQSEVDAYRVVYESLKKKRDGK